MQSIHYLCIRKSQQMVNIRFIRVLLLVAIVTFLWSCSSTKHVQSGEYLLNNVSIDIEDANDVSSSELYNYLRQTPNHKVLGGLKIQLATYNMSGQDTTKWYNRWLRRLGQAPVIYDHTLTTASANQLHQAMINKGYLGASVSVDTIRKDKKKKIDVSYTIKAGEPHRIASVDYQIADTTIAQYIYADTARSSINPGDLFDINDLDAERTLIANRLRNRGYYAFNKEYITFTADTAVNSKEINLTLNVNHPINANDTTKISHRQYYIRKVIFVVDYESGSIDSGFVALDTIRYKDINILYGKDHYIKPKTLEECCFIIPGEKFQARNIDLTHEALGRLEILKFINISMTPIAQIGKNIWLDAYILMSRNKKQGVTLELEGTNSEGDFGFGVGVTYQHRNLAKGSEVLTAKFRTAYESLSGNFDGIINDRYTEYATEIGITFPKFVSPFLSKGFKRRMKATTEFAVSFNYQERPEYTRIIAGTAWKYKWNNRQNTTRRTFDLLDINYVYLPKSTIDFIDQIAPSNPLLRYSYEDHFIMKMGYTYYRTNKRVASTTLRKYILQPSIYTLRTSIETAGNVLYALSNAFGQKKEDGAYKLFDIQYSQYVKGELDYTYMRNFNTRNSLAFHVGFGIGIPYANSSVLPFEKRFYAGGANGVRGWSVRTLGPGNYDSHNSVTDFINQCGDIRFDMSVEYRAKLFWVFEGALFVDAGNVWTIHNYENQPGGKFKFNTFYNEIAMAYGAGLRLDFTYFLLRFDLGLKAYNPAKNEERWPIVSPKWKRDATFHFAVGYPF